MEKKNEEFKSEVVEGNEGIYARPVNTEVACQTAPEPELITKWKAKYGDVYAVTCDDDDLPLTLYFRKPTRQHLSRFTKSIATQGDAVKAMNNFIQDTLIYPEMDTLMPLLTEKPGLVIPIGQQLQEIVGSNKHFLAKRL